MADRSEGFFGWTKCADYGFQQMYAPPPLTPGNQYNEYGIEESDPYEPI